MDRTPCLQSEHVRRDFEHVPQCQKWVVGQIDKSPGKNAFGKPRKSRKAFLIIGAQAANFGGQRTGPAAVIDV